MSRSRRGGSRRGGEGGRSRSRSPLQRRRPRRGRDRSATPFRRDGYDTSPWRPLDKHDKERRLVGLLRNRAPRYNVRMRSDGYVMVREMIKKVPNMKRAAVTEEEVLDLVRGNDHFQIEVDEESGWPLVRASDKHRVRDVHKDNSPYWGDVGVASGEEGSAEVDDGGAGHSTERSRGARAAVPRHKKTTPTECELPVEGQSVMALYKCVPSAGSPVMEAFYPGTVRQSGESGILVEWEEPDFYGAGQPR